MSNVPGLRGAVALTHFFLRERVRPGDRVVDATCGNGKDTLLLAELVGPAGRVWGFDIQEEAIVRTGKLLAETGHAARVTLVHAGHERLAEVVAGPLRAVVFNLGYLPGGDPAVVTDPANTRAALEQAAALLAPGGQILIALYTGHPGGKEEEEALLRWAAELPPLTFNVWQQRQLNRPPTAPYLILVEKAPRRDRDGQCA